MNKPEKTVLDEDNEVELHSVTVRLVRNQIMEQYNTYTITPELIQSLIDSGEIVIDEDRLSKSILKIIDAVGIEINSWRAEYFGSSSEECLINLLSRKLSNNAKTILKARDK